MHDLKPCPFCGGKDSGILTTSYDGYWFAVFCENCMAQTRKCRQEKDAVEAWNRRAGEEDKHVTDLDKFPTIDAVPAIRCRECKQGEVYDPDCADQYYCHAGCGWNNGDFYCAYGEREEGADNG